MLNYDNLLIAIALLFCSYASYTDIKYGKVPNICSFGLIYAGTVAQVMFIFEGRTAVGYSLSVVILSGFVAFAFYWFGIMAPEDAKLFWGACMILPIKSFENARGIVSFPPVVVLINTLIIYFCFIFFFLFFKTSSKQKKEAFFSMFSKSQFSKEVFSSICFLSSHFHTAFTLLPEELHQQAVSLSGTLDIVLRQAVVRIDEQLKQGDEKWKSSQQFMSKMGNGGLDTLRNCQVPIHKAELWKKHVRT